MPDRDRVRGALLGLAVGDALGMPITGFSHQNVRTFYKGIKAFRADERRGEFEAGQWSGATQLALASAGALAEAGGAAAAARAYADRLLALRPDARRWRPAAIGAAERLAEGLPVEQAGDLEARDNGAAVAATALGVWASASGASREDLVERCQAVLGVTHRHPLALAAGFGHASAIQSAQVADNVDGPAFVEEVAGATAWAEDRFGVEGEVLSVRLRTLAGQLDLFPLDLQDLCDGTGSAVAESWPFAVAMFARNPRLVEASLLSAINVGGDASGIGALLGGLLGALNGWSAFPAEWHADLEAAAGLTDTADALAT